jgi:hypothetical protein
MKETRKNNTAKMTGEDDEAKKISRVAAFIFSVHGDKAVDYARRLEAESEVPDMAERVRIEVERLAKRDVPAVDTQAASTSLSEDRP